MTDDTGTAIAVNSYDPYGIPALTNLGRFGYTGQTWLPELKMYNYKARIYSATLGRFMQTDPIGYGDGMNMYAYVANDPVNNRDPSGLGCVGFCNGVEKNEPIEGRRPGGGGGFDIFFLHFFRGGGSESRRCDLLSEVNELRDECGGGSPLLPPTPPEITTPPPFEPQNPYCKDKFNLPTLQLDFGGSIFVGYGLAMNAGVFFDFDSGNLALFATARSGEGIGLTGGASANLLSAPPTAGRSETYNLALSAGYGGQGSTPVDRFAPSVSGGASLGPKYGFESSKTDNITKILPIISNNFCG